MDGEVLLIMRFFFDSCPSLSFSYPIRKCGGKKFIKLELKRFPLLLFIHVLPFFLFIWVIGNFGRLGGTAMIAWHIRPSGLRNISWQRCMGVEVAPFLRVFTWCDVGQVVSLADGAIRETHDLFLDVLIDANANLG